MKGSFLPIDWEVYDFYVSIEKEFPCRVLSAMDRPGFVSKESSSEGVRNAVAYDLARAGVWVKGENVLFFPSRGVAFEYITGFGRRKFAFEPETFLPGSGVKGANKCVWSTLNERFHDRKNYRKVLLDVPFRVPGDSLPCEELPDAFLLTYPFLEPLVVLVDLGGEFVRRALDDGYVEVFNPLGGSRLVSWALNPQTLGKYEFVEIGFEELRRRALSTKEIIYPSSMFGHSSGKAPLFKPSA